MTTQALTNATIWHQQEEWRIDWQAQLRQRGYTSEQITRIVTLYHRLPPPEATS